MYFIQNIVTSEIKIGVSTDVPTRLRELQLGEQSALVLIATLPGDRHTEAALHRFFALEHSHGEWFNGIGSLGQYAAALAEVA